MRDQFIEIVKAQSQKRGRQWDVGQFWTLTTFLIHRHVPSCQGLEAEWSPSWDLCFSSLRKCPCPRKTQSLVEISWILLWNNTRVPTGRLPEKESKFLFLAKVVRPSRENKIHFVATECLVSLSRQEASLHVEAEDVWRRSQFDDPSTVPLLFVPPCLTFCFHLLHCPLSRWDSARRLHKKIKENLSSRR